MKIYSNLAMSVDGKIDTARRKSFILGSKRDHALMKILRKKADAVLIGGETLRSHPNSISVLNSKRPIFNILMSRNLNRIHHKMKFFNDNKVKRIIFTGPNTPFAKIITLSKKADIRVMSNIHNPAVTAKRIVKYLEKIGVKTLLIEGGGEVMWAFLKANLIDELYVTLTPRIIGGKNAPTLVDGEGFNQLNSLKLKLKIARRIKDEVFLKYAL